MCIRDRYNPLHRPGEHVRVFPLSNWTELDVWHYIAAEEIDLPPLYYAHDREVFNRDGMWLAVGPVSEPRASERVRTLGVRYRTVGDMSCTGAVESDAADVDAVLLEVAATRITERGATRACLLYTSYFAEADYGIVGDLYDVVPALTSALG